MIFSLFLLILFFFFLGLELAKKVQVVSGPKLVDFKKVLAENPEFRDQVESLKKEVEEFSSQFPMPGLDTY